MATTADASRRLLNELLDYVKVGTRNLSLRGVFPECEFVWDDCNPDEPSGYLKQTGLWVRVEDRECTVDTLSGPRTRVEPHFVIDAEVTYPGTYWDPPDSDFNELAAFKATAPVATAEFLIQTIVMEHVRGCLDAHAEAIYYAEQKALEDVA